MIGEPFGEDGSHETCTDPFPAFVVTFVGTVGPAAGVIIADAVDATVVPTAFVAVTVK